MSNESYTLETVLANFEAGWAECTRSEINQTLCANRSSPELLEELIHSDLELRLKNGEPARVESYLHQFSELGDNDLSVCSLLKTEYTIRRRREPDLDFSEYVVRFPELYPCLLEITPVSDWESQWKQSRARAGEQNGTSGPAESTLFDSDGYGHLDSKEHLEQEEVSYMSLRFSAESIHAAGGLGNIWLAHDHELNRKVALKEIRNKHAGNPALQARFIQEALITGALDHPGVAPVYSLSRFRDGRPYYAMRLIRGDSLAERIRSFHQTKNATHKTQNSTQPTNQAGGRDLREDMEFRRLIKHFLDACNTIEFAHSRGVIHRDIKPDNILIGEYGETLVVDWGLAKLSPLKDSKDAPVISFPDHPGDIGHFSSRETTSYGDVVGSPAFMSPEQAQGDLSAVGFLSDVYSLGATLYSILTNCNRPAELVHPDAAIDESNLSPRVARQMAPLMSVCRKAMSLQPRDRYQSPDELRENVEKFLAFLPVDGHSETLSERTSRLVRRHGMLVRAAAAILVITAVVSTCAAIWINGERAKAATAATTAQRLAGAEELARIEMEKSAESNRNLSDIVTGILLQGDGPANRGRLPTRAQHIEKFETEIELADPLTRMRGLMVLGQNESRTGDQTAAREYYQRAVQICKEILPLDSKDYLECLGGLAAMTYWSGDESRSRELVQELIALIESSESADATHRISAYSIQAEIERDLAEFPDAIDSAQLAAEFAEGSFGSTHQTTIEAKNLHAGILVSRDTAEDRQSAALILNELVELIEDNSLSDTRAAQAVYSTLGHLQMNGAEYDKAEETFVRVIESRTEQFGATDPETLKAARSLGDCKLRLAQTRRDKAERMEALEQAIELLEQTRSAQFENAGAGSREYGMTLLFLGNAWRHHSKLKPLDNDTFEYRCDVLDEALEAAVDRGDTDLIVLRLRNILGTLFLSMKQPEAALEQYELAADGWGRRRELDSAGQRQPAEDQLVVNYANLLQVSGEPSKARRMLQQLIESHPDPKLNWHVYLANSCYLSGEFVQTVEYFQPVIDDFQQREQKRISAPEFLVFTRYLNALAAAGKNESALELCRRLSEDNGWILSQTQQQTLQQLQEELDDFPPLDRDELKDHGGS